MLNPAPCDPFSPRSPRGLFFARDFEMRAIEQSTSSDPRHPLGSLRIRHEVQVLAPLSERPVLPIAGLLPQLATDLVGGKGHHLLSRKIKFIDEFASIRHIER